MAGDAELERIAAYVSRLRGEAVSARQPVALRSIERAALASWVRKEGLAIRAELLTTSVPFTLEQLLSRAPSGDTTSLLALPVAAPERVGVAGVPGAVGIDIEAVESLPHADDYREHSFYQDHFTPAEIAHCVRQRDVRASFCGTWAAKEAILKAGLVPMGEAPLRTIEISRDEVGRPTYPRCAISISHTPLTAVAVCFAA